MTRCKTTYVQTPLGLTDELIGLANELKQARKDRQDLLTALVAIVHRRQGVFDSWQLTQYGPLTTNMANDMATIAKKAYDMIVARSKASL
jgi:hypothetical protein